MTHNLPAIFYRLRIRRGLAFGIIIVAALGAFEIFNFSTTEFALSDLLGELQFAGVSWATILAVAFCGIDFAGIARLFTPEQGMDEATEVWYLFAAWLLAACMNAILTWWGVSIAILSHKTLGNAFISQGTMLSVVPIFVAIMVWLIRVLIIGTFSVAGERLFSQADTPASRRTSRPALQPTGVVTSRPRPSAATSFQTASKVAQSESAYPHTEPTYHNLSMSAKSVRKAEYVDAPRHS
jgi:hypothetical protein